MASSETAEPKISDRPTKERKKVKKIQKGVTERMSPPPLPPPPSSPPPNYAKQETKIGRSPSPSPAPCTSAAARPVASFPEPSPSPRSSTKKHFASMSEMKSTQDHDVPHAGSDLAPSSPVEESETLSDFLRSARLPFELEVPLKEMGATLAIDLLDLEDEDIMDLARRGQRCTPGSYSTPHHTTLDGHGTHRIRGVPRGRRVD
eukprot:CAMPEP_0119470670 /NCGR_PEP_ID=MMETSP1344-20130328/3472_1 /TAXON_ID=236787 /ORGANISM="Florenciella parvula, Strain CCMP2471" /LENGTH=203 /DNA_ID=CAMNT_0007503373 /DNA_START=297 /DNA_END=908 /DNA_ORIENTATION=-